MDLVSSIRKQGSRGGVNFNWEDVSTSAHRENYLGHSLKAPVGRWQKGRDLNWYAKADGDDSSSNETPEEKAARERKEELRKIKEAEEDALARALGLPVAPRNATGANAVDVGESRVPQQNDAHPEAEVPNTDTGRPNISDRHTELERRHRRRHRSRSRSRNRDTDRRGDRHRHHNRDRDRDRHRDRLSPRGDHEISHARSKDGGDDRRTHRRRRSHSRERGPNKLGPSYGREDDRSHRSHKHRQRSPLRDQRRSQSPQRPRRRDPARD